MEVESDLVRLQQQFASLEAKYHEVQGKYVLCKSEKERLMKENGYLKKTRQRFSPEVEGEVEILRSKLASSEAVAKKYATWTADLFKHMESARTAMTESFSSGEKKIKDLQDEVDSLKLENEKLKGVDIPSPTTPSNPTSPTSPTIFTSPSSETVKKLQEIMELKNKEIEEMAKKMDKQDEILKKEMENCKMLERKVKSLESEKNHLEMKVKALFNHKNEQDQRLKEKKDEICTKDQELMDLKAANETLVAENEELTHEIERLKNTPIGVPVDTERTKKLEAKIAKKTQENESLQIKIETLQHKLIEDAEQRIMESERVQKVLEDFLSDHLAVLKENEKLREENVKFFEGNKRLRHEVEELRLRVSDPPVVRVVERQTATAQPVPEDEIVTELTEKIKKIEQQHEAHVLEMATMTEREKAELEKRMSNEIRVQVRKTIQIERKAKRERIEQVHLEHQMEHERNRAEIAELKRKLRIHPSPSPGGQVDWFMSFCAIISQKLGITFTEDEKSNIIACAEKIVAWGVDKDQQLAELFEKEKNYVQRVEDVQRLIRTANYVVTPATLPEDVRRIVFDQDEEGMSVERLGHFLSRKIAELSIHEATHTSITRVLDSVTPEKTNGAPDNVKNFIQNVINEIRTIMASCKTSSGHSSSLF